MSPFFKLLILSFFVACSSSETVEVGSSNGTPLQTVRIYKKSDLDQLQKAALGTLPFFYGGVQGLDVSSIKWNQPVSPENPGADCDLVYVQGKGSSHYFRCIVKESGSHIILTLQEDLIEGQRLLRRIFMDGKGAELTRQWSASLERIGYSRAAKPPKGVSARYFSSKTRSFADIIWISKTKAATLRITPVN